MPCWASIFHYGAHSIATVKDYLAERGGSGFADLSGTTHRPCRSRRGQLRRASHERTGRSSEGRTAMTYRRVDLASPHRLSWTGCGLRRRRGRRAPGVFSHRHCLWHRWQPAPGDRGGHRRRQRPPARQTIAGHFPDPASAARAGGFGTGSAALCAACCRGRSLWSYLTRRAGRARRPASSVVADARPARAALAGFCPPAVSSSAGH